MYFYGLIGLALEGGLSYLLGYFFGVVGISVLSLFLDEDEVLTSFFSSPFCYSSVFVALLSPTE